MENIAKNRLQISIAFNIILIIMTLIGFYMCLQEKGRFTFFRFYTEDSNLLSMLVCIIYVVVGVIQLKSGITDIPKWVQVLKYITTSCLMVTFTVVVLVLAPLDHMNYKEYLFTGSMFFYHFLCPLITIMTFILFDYGDKLDVRCKFYALIPTIIYAIVLIVLNILRVTKGPYVFLRVYDQPVYMSCIWFVVVIGMAYLLAWGTLALKFLHR